MIYYLPNEGVASASAFQVNILTASVWLELNRETHVLRKLTWTLSFCVWYDLRVILFSFFEDNMFDFTFFFNSVLIGIGLAMDAFSVSLANGLNEPDMSSRKTLGVAGIFGLFQGMMPLIGWFCVHSIATAFSAFEKFIPWIALGLLGYIGGKMLHEGIQEYKCKSEGGEECPVPQKLGLSALLVQGIATSIDALSVGFTISDYIAVQAIVCALLIAVITFGICFAGILLGKRFGTALAGKSAIFGGSILIFIGLEIFISSFLK